jgi:hypothetical protein
VDSARRFGCSEQCPNVRKRRAQWLFDDAWKPGTKQLDAKFGDSLDRNHRDATIETVSRQHFIHFSMCVHEAILATKEFGPMKIQIARRSQFDLSRVRVAISGERDRMSALGVFAATNES